ncbi:plasmid replication protein, partial [Enterococcus faecalis]
DELIDTWATYAEKRIVKQESQVKWYKYAKSRSERIYSHKNEWLQDIIDLINRIGIDKDSVEISTRRIREELNISAASLNRVLKQAVKSNKLVIKKGRGNKPSKLATLSMALKALFAKNQQLKDQWISYLKQHLWLETTKFIE